jgi:hypothetical protein
MTIDFDLKEIIELARLVISIDIGGPELYPKLDFQRRMDCLQMHERIAVVMAVKLLYGDSYGIISGNPRIVACARSVAAELGAMVEYAAEAKGRISIIFRPAPVQ